MTNQHNDLKNRIEKQKSSFKELLDLQEELLKKSNKLLQKIMDVSPEHLKVCK